MPDGILKEFEFGEKCC